MKKYITSNALAIALTAIMVIPAGAVGYSADPWVYNPDDLSGITAEWRADMPAGTPISKDTCKNGGWQDLTNADGNEFKNQGACVAYYNHHPAEDANQVLFLEKDQLTSANAAAGATIEGIETGTVLSELGFDYNGYCGAGAPRFNVYTSDTIYYFFGCTYGTHTALGDGWTRVRFDDTDAVPVAGLWHRRDNGH